MNDSKQATQTVDLAAWLTRIWDEEERGIREALKTEDYGVTQFDLDRLAADRKILELHVGRPSFARSGIHCWECRGWGPYPCTTVRLLASPYKGREGWQEAWE